MKLLIVADVYHKIENEFYNKYPDLKSHDYRAQKKSFDLCYYNYQVSGWCNALNNIGYCTENVIINVEHLQRTWAQEHLINANRVSLSDIVIQQVLFFQPDVLWFDVVDENLLSKIREQCPNIRLILGWVGSAITQSNQWKNIDVILSCAQESVDNLNRQGCCARHLNHAFYPPILKKLKKEQKIIESLVFIGQIIRSKDFHLERERILVALKNIIDLQIYSPSAEIGYSDIVKVAAKQILYDFLILMKQVDCEQIVSHIPVVKKSMAWKKKPIMPIDLKLKNKFCLPVFGMDMFNVLYNAGIVLNIHADSSPQYASNMRLFETTGVGTCLVTDWKQNINTLFESYKEVVVYDSIEDCIEKVQWLKKHPQKRKEIAMAGMKKCLAEHTYMNRINRLDKIIREYV